MKSNNNKIYVDCFYYGFYIDYEIVKKHNIDIETINRQSNQINYRKINIYHDKSNFDSNKKNLGFDKTKRSVKSFANLDKLQQNIETNNKSIFDYSFSSMLKSFKILEKLNKYDVRNICISFSLSSLSRLTSYINY